MAGYYRPTYFLFGITVNCAIKERRSRKALKPLPFMVHMNTAKSQWSRVEFVFALK